MPADMTQPANALAALGSQPGPLPTSHNDYRADALHFQKGRSPYKLPRYIIVHSTVGKDSRAWLTTSSKPPDNVSAHVLVQGNDRYNLVDFLDTAYAAGTCLPGINNADTLNIEIENLSGYVYPTNGGVVNEPYSDATMNNAAHCVAAWCFAYGIPLANVRRHADVAVYPADYEVVALRGKLGRKHDPVNFDWHDFLNRVQAWLTFFAALPQSEHAHYIELAQPPAAPIEYPFLSAPTISLAVFTRVLASRNSPILQEGYTAELYYNMCKQYGINPAIALAFTIHENGAGTTGVTAPLKNWGAVRSAENPALATQDSPVQTSLGKFAKYQSWLTSLQDWCARIKGPKYLGGKPDMTVREALHIYAPSSDPLGANNPDAYADAVRDMVAGWKAESGEGY